MKKLLLSTFGFAAMMAGANAQIFSENFDAGIPATFTLNDVDGGTPNANVGTLVDAWNAGAGEDDNGLSKDCVLSTSWISTPTTADDWMSTPAIVIPVSVNPIVLEWNSMAVDATYPDGLQVFTSTSGATPADFTGANGSQVYISANELPVWTTHQVVIADNQTIYVGFRNNSTDQFVLAVDDIIVRELLPDDAEMTTVNLVEFGTGGNETITGTITNNGSNDITSFDISYTVDSGTSVNENFTQTVTSGNTYNYTLAAPLATVSGNTYSVEVTVTAANDAEGSNDMLAATHSALTTIPTKVVVGEENTGTWCGWCPRGDVGLSGMNTDPNFIGIAVHNGDPMAVAAYDAGASTYFPSFSGFPNGAVDRVIGGDPSTFSTMNSQRSSAIVPCAVNNITAVFNQATGMIEVSADADFVGNVTGDYRLSCVIVEDNIETTGNGWSQVNYYDGGGNGTLTDPTSGFEWSTAGDPVAPTAFGGYKHVAISLSNDDILGDAGSIVTNPTVGTYNHVFTGVAGSIANDQTFANVHAVVMIVNAATAEILNAGISAISVVTSTEKIADAKFALTVFPNPTTDNANVTFSLETANNVKMEVYNAMGALVSTKNAGKLAVGNHTMAFDGTNLNAGFYFVNLTIGNNLITKKVTLTK
jgi:hypothetical protein